MNPSLPTLPITEALPALARALDDCGCAVLMAPPGAGKSTLVPLALLNSAWRADKKILMLEPRRLATRAVAARMASLLGEPVGRTVGYRTRLETRVSGATRIEVLTEGILTRMLQSDAALSETACVIFDEFHERSLNADLALALSLESRAALREDLRLLVMSATLDTAQIAGLLGNAPIVTAAGRSFEVAIEYRGRRNDLTLEQQMTGTIRKALQDHDGDILAFLPGAPEIRRVEAALSARSQGPDGASLEPNIDIRCLYGDLQSDRQDLALAPAAAGRRKIVLATSIAETSLTIEGVRIVVDSGLRRYSQFDPATGMSRLVTGKVSQASAAQRSGRAGRLSSGVCLRLWSQSTQDSLAPQTPPEILHADLAPLALELARWGARDASALSWLDEPPRAPLAQARALLRSLSALDAQDQVTKHGIALADLGAHPRLAHMLMAAPDLGAQGLACDLAAIVSERDVLRAPPGSRDADLRLRVELLRGRRHDLPSGMSVDERLLDQLKKSASDWRRRLDPWGANDPRASARTASAARLAAHGDGTAMTGAVLALAYPDRIARNRGENGRFLLANGRGAIFASPQPLSGAAFIVIAELDGAERDARIHSAAPISLDDLEQYFAALVSTEDCIAWDSREHALSARRERRLQAIVLDSKPLQNPDPDAVLAGMLEGIRIEGIDALPWTDELRQWRARVELLRRQEVPSPQAWPDLSDATLIRELSHWLPPWLDGVTRREHFARIDLNNALHSRLTYAQSAVLDREAPSHFVVPSGSRLPIDYLGGDAPSLSVRLQEMFGLNHTPAVAAHRVPLLLKLLSPAQRPVQITRDLPSFWERGYHDVKKDLKGRYPKHYWPDDPHTAQPTRRARPR